MKKVTFKPLTTSPSKAPCTMMVKPGLVVRKKGTQQRFVVQDVTLGGDPVLIRYAERNSLYRYLYYKSQAISLTEFNLKYREVPCSV